MFEVLSLLMRRGILDRDKWVGIWFVVKVTGLVLDNCVLYQMNMTNFLKPTFHCLQSCNSFLPYLRPLPAVDASRFLFVMIFYDALRFSDRGDLVHGRTPPRGSNRDPPAIWRSRRHNFTGVFFWTLGRKIGGFTDMRNKRLALDRRRFMLGASFFR